MDPDAAEALRKTVRIDIPTPDHMSSNAKVTDLFLSLFDMFNGI